MVQDGREFTYNLDFDLTADATKTLSFTVETGSIFTLLRRSFACFASGSNATPQNSATLIPNVKVQITDSSQSNRPMFNNPVYISALFGNGALPWVLPQPYVIPGGSVISVTATSSSSDEVLFGLYFAGIRQYTQS